MMMLRRVATRGAVVMRARSTIRCRQFSAASQSTNAPVKVIDPLDQVYGTEDFNFSKLRQVPPDQINPATFDELREQNPHLLSLGERKYRTLDPHDYLLEGIEFPGVSETQYTIVDAASDPAAHSDPASVGKYFPLGHISEGIAKSLEQEVSVTKKRLLMVRKPALKVIAGLQAFADGNFESGPAPFTLLTGERHSGKSATLTHVVDFARQNNWLTFFLPRMHSLLHDSGIMEPSLRRPGFIDQPSFGRQLLKEIGEANGDLLKSVTLKTKEDPESLGRLDGFDTLADVVAQHDNKDPKVDHVGLLLDTLRELAAVTEHPVLIAIDDFNQLYQVTGYFYDGEPVQPEQLTIVNALRYFQSGEDGRPTFAPQHPIRNGVVVAAESHHRVLSKTEQEDHLAVWRPIRKAADRTAVPLYNIPEVESCMRHYFCQNLCFQEPTDTAAKTMHLLTNGVPSELLLACANRSNFHVEMHLPDGQPGGRKNQWKLQR